MSYEIQRTAPCLVSINAEVAADEAGGEREKVVSTYLKNARVDGFRRGKAPRSMVERRFAKEIRDDLEEALLRRLWGQVQDEGTLRPAGPLGVKEAAWQSDGSFRVSSELEVYPEVVLPDLEGFTPPELGLEPTEEEEAKTLDGLRERHATWEPVDGEPVAEGMLVEAEVKGEFPEGGGEPFHEERSLFQLGEGEVFPEIEAAVTGKSVGDEVTAERVMGPEAGEERDGKKVTYTVTIKSLRRKRLPEADDAFAASLGIIDGGIELLRERVHVGLVEEKKRLRLEMWRGALVRHLQGDTPLDLPAGVLAEETREELMKFVQSLARRGVDPEKADLDWKKVEEEIRQKVSERLRAEIVIDALAEERGISVNDDDVDAEIEKEAKRINVPFAELKGNLGKGGGMDKIRAILRRERTVDEVLRPHLGEEASDAGSDSR